MKLPDNLDDLKTYALNAYRFPKDTDPSILPPVQGAQRTKTFYRVTRYRPQITAKNKILWKAEEHVADMLSYAYIDSSASDRRACVHALVSWDPNITDFSAYRRVFLEIRNRRATAMELVDKGLIRIRYVRTSHYDYRQGLEGRILPDARTMWLNPDCLSLIHNVTPKEFDTEIKAQGYAWLPTDDNSKEACVALFGYYPNVTGGGLHSKPIAGVDALSAHEKMRICMALRDKGWRTDK